jgi:glycosyltransferase involved in cell wall biosynthesis
MHIHLASVYHFQKVNGGNERYCHQLANGLIQSGLSVTYLCSSPRPSNIQYTYKKLPVLHLLGKPIPTPIWLKTQPPLPDIYHAAGSGIPLLTLAKAYKNRGIKTILTFQAPNNPTTLLFKLATQLELSLINRYIDVLITTSPGNQSYLRQSFPNKPVKLVPLCFTPPENPLPNVSSQKNDQIRILMVANLDNHHYYKGVEVAIQALASLPHNYHLDIVGDGNQRNKYQNQIFQLGLNREITLQGKISDQKLSQLYDTASLYIQPSTSASEGFGLSLLDAMYRQIPTVTTKVIGLAPWLKHDQLSTLVPPKNPIALGQAIQSVSAQNNRKMVRAAKAFAANLTCTKMNHSTIKVYQEVQNSLTR